MLDLVGDPAVLIAASPGSFRLRNFTEQNAQFLIDLIALFDEPSCMREFVVEHGHAFFRKSVATFATFLLIAARVRE